MKRIVAMLLIVIAAISLAGCSGGSVAGKYKIKSMMGMDVKELQEQFEAYGMEGKVEDMMYLELKSDKTFTMVVVDEEPANGTYSISGDTISLTVDGETVSGTIKGKTITISEGGMEMVFEK